MSTRSATIFKQTTYWGEEAKTSELLRFYRHTDGYPEGHGMDLARAIALSDKAGVASEYWALDVLGFLACTRPPIEIEPYGMEHGDIEFLYVVEGLVDHRWGKRNDGTLPVTISVYQPGWNEPYVSVITNGKPIFSGTAYDYIKEFGKE